MLNSGLHCTLIITQELSLNVPSTLEGLSRPLKIMFFLVSLTLRNVLSLFSPLVTRLAPMQYDIQYTLPITVIIYFDTHIFIDWAQDSSSNWFLAAANMFL